jgi:hypothetical protein
MRRKRPAAVKRTVGFDPELDPLIQQALGRKTLSEFVNEACAQRLARWESPAAFVQRKRKRLGHREQSAFDSKTCHASGWPKKIPTTFWRFGEPADHIANLKQMLGDSQPRARELMAKAWQAAGLSAYSDRDWDATLAWYRGQQEKVTAPSDDAAPETLPEGWGQ